MNQWRFAGQNYPCPLVLTIHRLSGRWKTNILWFIYNGTRRFNSICRKMPWVNKGVILRQLRSLERDGLIRKIVLASHPEVSHIEYEYTDLGLSLVPAIVELAKWGSEHGQKIAGIDIPKTGNTVSAEISIE